jgi:hypothetical protein
LGLIVFFWQSMPSNGGNHKQPDVPASSDSDAVVRKGIRGVSSLVALQVSSRVLTFLLNVALARQVDPAL